MHQSTESLLVTSSACAWLTGLLDPGGSGVVGVDEDTVLGGAGVRLSLGQYLTFLEWLAARCGCAVDSLVDRHPPYTVGALVRAAVRT